MASHFTGHRLSAILVEVRELPTGTVTFLFTDIEGSTRLLQELGASYAELLAGHRHALREVFDRHDGVEVDTQGDAFFVAFVRATEALAAAQEGREALAPGPIRVRMGLHTGEPTVTEEGYVGLEVHRAARIAAAAHGGQIVLSQRTRDLLDSAFELRDLGEHRLKDLAEPVQLYQLGDEQFPPLKTISNTNLPAPANRLVGRLKERAELRELLLGDERLITLTGAGGSGKSRLAVAIGLELLEEFPHGVFFVELASVMEPAHVGSVFAQSLGVRETSAQPLIEALTEHLRDKRTLLVVDNFEHLLEAAPIVSELVQTAPRLAVLTTSRERLRLAHEREYPLSPLPQRDAISLFVERAQAPGAVELTGADDEAIAGICRQLDGLPLALELAAARVKVLPPTKLFERLEQRLPLLTGGARDLPERQRTLRATIEWSYDLLDAEEQQLFAALSVFLGGCTLEAAEHVCGAEFETFASLVDKSLLRQSEQADGEPRFWMLETIREYATTRLLDETRDRELPHRHAMHYAALARRLQPALRKTDRSATERIEAEHENMRAALRWSLDGGSVECALELVWNLKHFWIVRGYGLEGDAWARRALAASEHLSRVDRVWAIAGAADLANFAGDYDRAIRLKLASIEGLRTLGEEDLVTGTFADLVFIVAHQGDLERARQFEQQASSAAQASNTARGWAFALTARGFLAFRERRFAGAREALAGAARAWEEEESIGDVANCALMIGECFRREGELAQSRRYLLEGVRVIHETGAKFAIPEALEETGALALADGDVEEAIVLLAAVAAAANDLEGPRWDPADYERNLVHARERVGRDTFEAGWNTGLKLDPEEALIRALATLER